MGTVRSYVKLPIPVKAAKLGRDLSILEAKVWVNSQAKDGRVAVAVQLPDERDFGLEIETLEGKMLARIGDYIIQGVQGEFYPCKPDIFESTYQEVRGE